MKSFTVLLLFVILETDERAEAAVSWLWVEIGRQAQKCPESRKVLGLRVLPLPSRWRVQPCCAYCVTGGREMPRVDDAQSFCLLLFSIGLFDRASALPHLLRLLAPCLPVPLATACSVSKKQLEWSRPMKPSGNPMKLLPTLGPQDPAQASFTWPRSCYSVHLCWCLSHS